MFIFDALLTIPGMSIIWLFSNKKTFRFKIEDDAMWYILSKVISLLLYTILFCYLTYFQFPTERDL